jgi:hypothetical protein
MIRTRSVLAVLGLGALFVWASGCASSDNAGTIALGGSGAGSVAGATNSAAGTGGSAGAPSTSGASGAGAGGASGGGVSGSTSIAGTGGALGVGGATGGSAGSIGAAGGGNRTQPTCAQSTPSPNDDRAGECDYLLQSLDFEDKQGYTTTPDEIKVTTYGQAFGLFAINSCSPYCYAKNLTVGIDIVGGSAAQTQGEIIVEFPKTGTGLPITAADMSRNALAWITFDGAAKPPFEIDAQLVIETATTVIPSVESKAFFKPGGNLAPFGPFNVTNNYSYGSGSEFKYFAVSGANGFPTAPTNVTGMGFRITAKATAGQEWHGVAYIDHLQVRGAGGDNPTDAGAYPYGL